MTQHTVEQFQEGEILYFDKPLGWTSFRLVDEVRYVLCRGLHVKKLKVGHAGTLDPLATGVMIVCTGRATKRIEEFQYQTKEYVATLEFGATTPSFDMEKEIDCYYDYQHINRELVNETLQQFLGTIEQVPPTFSACKIQGKRAYELAREGADIQLKAKTLTIDEIELLDYREEEGMRPQADIRVVCSKGTYIRALARDIGQALNSGAYLKTLKRTRVGEVRVENCDDIKEFRKLYFEPVSISFKSSENHFKTDS